MMLEKIIQATLNSLGYSENGVYFAEPDCYASLHDLVRYLHNDKDTLDARRICLVHNIVRNDLVPIMLASNTDRELFNMALRLTVNLCQPTIVAFGGKLPETDDVMQVYHDCESNLVNSLAAFTSPKIFQKFSDIVKQFFSKEWTDRNEADKTTVDRIIMLLRYIFAIGMECPATVEMAKIDSLVKERVLRAFLSTELSASLMTVGADKMEKELSVHIMAIFSLLLRSVDCERVACVKQERNLEEEQKEENAMKEAIERDRLILQARRSQLSTSRSHLGATYIMKNSALNLKKDLLVQKSNSSTPMDILRMRKVNKRATKRTRIRDVMESVFKPNKNAPTDICNSLNDFCKELILKSFDKIMKATREMAFVGGQKTGGVLAYSDINYFFLAEYIFQFIRLAKMPIEKAGSIFSREFFHSIVSKCDDYFDLMKINKLDITSYAVRAQHAISTYKEMMLLLHSLSTSEQPTNKEAFLYLTKTIYYNEEYREFCYLTLGRLQPQGMTRKLLHDLIIASHYYILIMDFIIKTGELQIVAKRKRIAKQRKKKAKEMLKEVEERSKSDKMNEEQLNELWNEVTQEISDVLEGKIEANEDISPINILLAVSDEQHQIFAALQIQRALRGRRITDAVGLLKASRDLWPDATFGDYSSSPDQDLSILKDIYNMDLIDIALDYDEQMKQVYGKENNNNGDTLMEEEHISVSDNEQKKQDEEKEGNNMNDSGNSEDEEEKPKYKIAEINFDFNEYILHFTKADIINWYIFALKDFETNSAELNRAILKMLYRIGFQLKTPSQLYLATLFRIFARVNTEIQKLTKEAAKKHQFYDIYKLGYHVLQKFFVHLKERGEVLICELLFSKTYKDCVDIENGYGTNEEQQNNATMLWTEELEEELGSLYNQYQALDEKPEGISVIDFIQHNLSKERYPKQIQLKLRRMGLLVGKLKRQKKDKVKKSKKNISEDELIGNNSSDENNNSSGEESSAEETDNDNTERFNKLNEEEEQFYDPLVGVENRLLQEESTFLATSSQHLEIGSQSSLIERREEMFYQRNLITEVDSQSLDSQETEKEDSQKSIGNKDDSAKSTAKKKRTKKQSPEKSKKPRKTNKYRETLQQPVEPIETFEAYQNEEEGPDENSKPGSQQIQQTHRRILESDESDMENENQNMGQFEEGENMNEDNMDGVNLNNTTKRFIDSDDDEEEKEVPLSQQRKRQRIVDSDDE